MAKIFVIALLVLLAVVSIAVITMPAGSTEVTRKLSQSGVEIKTLKVDYNDGIIHAKQIGPTGKPLLLLIHGSPGDWSNWVNILLDDDIRQGFCILAVDRVGYGLTTLPAQAELSEQTRPIWHLLDTFTDDSANVIVGHSYGAAVVEQMLLERPEYFDKAILVAGTLSPELQEPKWYNNIASVGLVNALLPRLLKSSNKEMVGLAPSLKANEPVLKNINEELVMLQGNDDILVPFETIDYFREYGPSQTEYVLVEDMNHFIPWSDPQLIIDACLR